MFDVSSRISAYDLTTGKLLQRREKLYVALMKYLRGIDPFKFKKFTNTVSNSKRIVSLASEDNAVIIEFSNSRLNIQSQPKDEYDQVVIRFALPFGYHNYFYQFDSHHVNFLVNKFRVQINGD